MTRILHGLRRGESADEVIDAIVEVVFKTCPLQYVNAQKRYLFNPLDTGDANSHPEILALE